MIFIDFKQRCKVRAAIELMAFALLWDIHGEAQGPHGINAQLEPLTMVPPAGAASPPCFGGSLREIICKADMTFYSNSLHCTIEKFSSTSGKSMSMPVILGAR